MEKTVEVHLDENVDARAIAEVVQEASKYESTLHLLAGNVRANVKSIMGMMALQLHEGDKITLVAEGGDETEAIAGLEACFTKA